MPYRLSIYINDKELYDEILDEWIRRQENAMRKRQRVTLNEVVVELIKLGIKARKLGIR